VYFDNFALYFEVPN